MKVRTKYLILFFLYINGSCFIYAQPPKTTSKKEKIAPCYQSKDEIVRGDCFYDLGLEFTNYEQYEFAIDNLNSALQFYPENSILKRARTHQALSLAHKKQSEISLSISHQKKAVALYKRSDSATETTKALEKLALLQIIQKDTHAAKNTLQEVVINNEIVGNKAGVIRAKTKIRELEPLSNDLDRSNRKDTRSSNYLSSNPSTGTEKELNLQMQTEYEEKLDNAVEEIEDEENEELIETYDAVGKYYSSRGNSEKAVRAKRKSFELAKKSKKPVVAKKSLELASSYLSNKQNEKAKTQLNYTIALADSLEDLETKVRAYKSVIALSEGNSSSHDSILLYYQDLLKYQDSLNRIKLQNLQSSTELLNVQKQQQLLIQQNEIIAIQAADIRLQKWLSIAIATLLLGAITLLWFIYKTHKKEKRNNFNLALRALRTQMNPHFIFNALNSINEFIANNDERKANRFLSSFSKLMRSVMQNNESDFIQLSQEIEILKEYLALEHFRFSEKFDYKFTIDENVDTGCFCIPPMILQPYIENAIWHGLRYREKKGLLTIELSKDRELLKICITDNGIGRIASQKLKTKNQKDHRSIAMKNISQRIEILKKLYGHEFIISISDLKPGTQVLISLSKIIVK